MQRYYREETQARVRVATIPAKSPPSRFWMMLILMLALLLLLGACGKKDAVSSNLTPIAPDVPPQDVANVPIGLEEASLTIDGGAFVENALSLQQNQPTILHVVNHDNQSYQLQIVPNLVNPTLIPATVTTQIEFTDPTAGTYEIQLLSSDGANVVARLSVDTETPAGNP